MSQKKELPVQRYHANARERDRTHSVNAAFSILRSLIPTEPADRKLSKIETLRLATSYISHLDAILIVGHADQPCSRIKGKLGGFYKNTFDNDNSFTRCQVCTFCLTMHKKYNLLITSQNVPDFRSEEHLFLPENSTSSNTILFD